MNMAASLDLKGLRGELRLDEPMARHVSWRSGGRAKRFFVPADLPDLSEFLKRTEKTEPLLFVGLGSNLLVRDGGFRGTVISMHAAVLRPEMKKGLVYAQAGVAAPKVARFAALHQLARAEFLAGIPGTVGGALAMNAGCYGSETWDVVAKAMTISRAGKFSQRSADEFETGYRHIGLRGAKLGEDEWFVAAWFRFRPGDDKVARRRIKELLARRLATQPLDLPNAGSVFRNPP